MAPALLILSALFHASWNTLAKWQKDPDADLLLILPIATLLGIGAWLWESAVLPPDGSAIPWAVGAGLFEALYLFCLSRTLRRNLLGLSYTVMRGGAMVLVWSVSLLFLQEPLTAWSCAGAVLVLTGIIIANRKGRVPEAHRNMQWGYLAAMGIAGYHLCYGLALNRGIAPSFLFAVSLTIAVIIFLVVEGPEKRHRAMTRFRHRPWPSLVGGLLCFLSFFLFLIGLRSSHPGVAITLRNTSIVFAQGFSVLIGDTLGKHHWLGAILVALGASLLVL